jgi:hypothetical protein
MIDCNSAWTGAQMSGSVRALGLVFKIGLGVGRKQDFRGRARDASM